MVKTERILHLTLKKEWYDKIISGEKPEEYREFKEYWIRRLCYFENEIESFDEMIGDLEDGLSRHENVEEFIRYFGIKFRDYTHIIFSNGYSKNRPQFKIELKKTEISTGVNKWGGSNYRFCFVLKLGDVCDL